MITGLNIVALSCCAPEFADATDEGIATPIIINAPVASQRRIGFTLISVTSPLPMRRCRFRNLLDVSRVATKMAHESELTPVTDVFRDFVKLPPFSVRRQDPGKI